MHLPDSGSLVPILATLVFLVSLRSEPGPILFGEESYPGELRTWGVLLRVFTLAAFQNFQHMWTALAYLGIYAWLAPSTKVAELLEFALFVAFALIATDLRTVLSERFSLFQPSWSKEPEETYRLSRQDRTPLADRSIIRRAAGMRSKSPAASNLSKKKKSARKDERPVTPSHDQPAIHVAESRTEQQKQQPSATSTASPSPEQREVPPDRTAAKQSKPAPDEAPRRALNFKSPGSAEVPNPIATKKSENESLSPVAPTSGEKVYATRSSQKQSLDDVKMQKRMEQQRRIQEREQKMKEKR